jgi:CNT family concentrative nucleoside transporter
MDANQLISAFGTAAMLFFAWLFCRHRSAINWRTILWGTALQFIFAFLILKTPPGHWIFIKTNDCVITLIGFQEEGAKFVFSSLAIPPGEPGSMGFFFAFQVLTTVIFLSSLMSLLYYLGVMQKVILFFGKIMQYTCGTSGAETLNAAANIFMGQTEAPLLVKPHLEDMTESELLCVMVAGMATIAAGVLVAYVAMLRPYFPDAAGHLMAAQVMSACGSLAIAKLMIPEKGKPETLGVLTMSYKDPNSNSIEAAASGAEIGLRLALNVGAMLIAFMSLLAMVNWGVHHAFGLCGHPDIGLEKLFGWFFSPLAWIMGVPWKDCTVIGYLIGEKTVLNEFVAYTYMAQYMASHVANPLSYRSAAIAVHALCGFSNLLSIGIQIGGIGVLAPGRRKDLARLGLYALIGGSLACFMNAAITGIFIP